MKLFLRPFQLTSLLLLVLSGGSFLVSAADEQQCANEGNDPDTCQGGNEKEEGIATDTELVFAPLGEPADSVVSSTGIRLAVRRWIPETTPKAVVLFHHGGVGWHSGYAKSMGEYMSSQGIALIAYDQIGSGYSDGIVYKDKQLRNYFDSMDTIANDFTKLMLEARQEFPSTKVFAMGESFGATVLLHQILIEQNSAGKRVADGYIFTGPVVKLLPEMLPPSVVLMIIHFLANYFPMLTMPGSDFFSTFDLAFGDKRWAKAGRADPIIQEAATLPPKLGMISSCLMSIANTNENLSEIKVPFHIWMGEHEGRVDTEAVKKLAEVADSKDKGITIVPDAFHQLFQDMPNVTQGVFESVKDWIMARV
ncbi:MAG: hypothetical protein SGILL_007690 [Bacillariaceae sp.]